MPSCSSWSWTDSCESRIALSDETLHCCAPVCGESGFAFVSFQRPAASHSIAGPGPNGPSCLVSCPPLVAFLPCVMSTSGDLSHLVTCHTLLSPVVLRPATCESIFASFGFPHVGKVLEGAPMGKYIEGAQECPVDPVRVRPRRRNRWAVRCFLLLLQPIMRPHADLRLMHG